MKRINKNNIEAWLLDFSEGQLNEEELALLESYLAENPEYKELLSNFEPFYLPIEEDIVFNKKDALLNPSPSGRVLHFSFIFPRLMAAAVLLAAMVLLWPLFQSQKINPEMRASLTSPEIHLPDNRHATKKQILKGQEEKNKKEENVLSHETVPLANRTVLRERKEKEKSKEEAREAPFRTKQLEKERIASITPNQVYNSYSEIPGWYVTKPVAMSFTLPQPNEERSSSTLMQSLLHSEVARAFIPETLEEDLPQAKSGSNDAKPVIYLQVPPAGKKIIDKLLNR